MVYLVINCLEMKIFGRPNLCIKETEYSANDSALKCFNDYLHISGHKYTGATGLEWVDGHHIKGVLNAKYGQ